MHERLPAIWRCNGTWLRYRTTLMIVWYEFNGDWFPMYLTSKLWKSIFQHQNTFFIQLHEPINLKSLRRKWFVSLSGWNVFQGKLRYEGLLEPLEQLAHMHAHISNRLFFKKNKISWWVHLQFWIRILPTSPSLVKFRWSNTMLRSYKCNIYIYCFPVLTSS